MNTPDVCLRPLAVAVFAAALALCVPTIASAASFGAPVSHPTGGIRPLSVAVGDIDGDGLTDLAAANNLSNTVGILLGNGLGGFSAPTTFPTGGAPAAVAIDDLNADGRRDLAIANRASGNVTILLGTIGGGFAPGYSFSAGSQPFGIATGDVNGDGFRDVLVANQVSDDVSVLLGDGSGSLAPPVSVPAGNGPQALALGDLDGDGDLDAAVALFDGDLMSILLNNGSGGFAAPALYSAGNGPQSVALGDLREDGLPDVAVANFFNDYASVFLGLGGGVFSSQTGFGAGDGPRSIAIGDLDGDGHNDLAIADSDSDTVSVLAGNGAGGFAAREPFPGGDSPSSIAIAQLDGGVLLDIVVADRFGEVVSVLPNTGTPPPLPDRTAPVITVPDPVTVDAVSPSGAGVTYDATAVDDLDPAPSLVCDPPSGATFAIGTTTVTCTAEDASGNTSSKTFTVEVIPDTVAPVLTVPDPIVVDATSAAGATVTFAAAAVDDRDADPTVTCSPSSGSLFPNGTTNVSCTARDWAGNADTDGFAVKINGVDDTAPTITPPGPIVVNATSPAGAKVTYVATTKDDRDPNPSLACLPPSGATFSIGATTGECTSRDASGNVSTASFAVRVKGAPEQIADLVDKIRAIRGLSPLAAALRVQLTSIAECAISRQKTKACVGASLFVAAIRLAAARSLVTAAQAESIIADVQRIKAVIGCP